MMFGPPCDGGPHQQYQIDHEIDPIYRDDTGAASLRPYQVDVIHDLKDAVAGGLRRIILVAPTGAGKTVIASDIIARAVRRNKRVLVLTHRREITAQTCAKLADCSVDYGVIQAGYLARPQANVQVASIQTLWERAIRRETMPLPPADLLIVDECHHAPAKTYQEIIESYPGAVLLGLTATPCRGDGRGLGGLFETIVECPQVAALIAQGYLVKTKVYAPVDPDLTGVRVQAGDYVESQLAMQMNQPQLIGDIVTHWHKYGERRKTIVFAVDVAHSIHLRDEFLRAGVRAEHIDGGTPKLERDAVLARLASGETELVSNCMVLTEGWDMPEVGCCILARPTKKMGLYRQMVGRVLRTAPGKTDAIVLDHSGAAYRHGLPDDHVAWTLDPDRRAESPAHQARLRKDVAGLLECSQCGALRLGGQPCPHCGFLPRRAGESVSIIDGDLGLVEGGRARPTEYDGATRAHWHGMLIVIAQERGYQRGWVAHKYREKFGVYPPWDSAPAPISPTPEARSWVRSRDIAYAKRRAAS